MILSPHGRHRGWARLGKTGLGDQGRGIVRHGGVRLGVEWLGMEQSGGLTPSANGGDSMKKFNAPMLYFRASKKMRDEVKKEAKLQGVSMSELIRLAIGDFLEICEADEA